MRGTGRGSPCRDTGPASASRPRPSPPLPRLVRGSVSHSARRAVRDARPRCRVMPRIPVRADRLAPDAAAPPWSAAVAVTIALLWIVFARIGPQFLLAPGVRAWYPPAALVAAATFLYGARAIAPLVAGALAASLLVPRIDEPLGRVLLVSILLKGIYWAGMTALRRSGFDTRFPHPLDVVRFGAATMATSVLAGVVGTLDAVDLLGALDDRTAVRHVFRVFWIGDVLAVFAITPVLLLLARGAARAPATLAAARTAWAGIVRTSRTLPRTEVVQFLALPAAVILARAAAPLVGFFAYALCFVPLLWIALSRGPRAAAVANLVLAVGLMMSLSGGGEAQHALEVQTFIALLALVGLLTGSIEGERARASRDLQRSEERYRRLVELLPDPLLVSIEGIVQYANAAAGEIFGARTPNDLLGRSLLDLATTRSRALIAKRIATLAGGDPVSLAHHTLHRLDGGTVEVESVSIPIEYQGRHAALTVGRDVTERTRLEESLRQAQRMEAVGQLAGGIAHDFNNLLTVIQSYSELLLAESPTPRVAHDVGEIHGAAVRAAALTRQLLAFSRRQVLRPEPVVLDDVIESTQMLLRRLIPPEIVIDVCLADPRVVILVDRGQLEQVLINLAVNARDAMPSGGVLTLATSVATPGSTPALERCTVAAPLYAVIAVRDTGVGIPAETLGRIFEPFFTTKPLGQGTGLGLATVHGIVEQSGGTVTVTSRPGAGTEFRVFLPVLETRARRSDAPLRGAGVPRTDRARTGRVLLADDDAAVRSGLSQMLQSVGYQVVEVADGAEALELLGEQALAVDVVVSDIAMPRLTGRALAREIAQRFPALPVILMTGYDAAGAGAAGGADGDVLLKPFGLDDLVRAIDLVRGAPPIG